MQDEPSERLGRDAQTAPDGPGVRILRPADIPPEQTTGEQSSVEEQDVGLELSELEQKQARLKHSVRGLMRNVPSSVAIITAACVDPDTDKYVPMGVAVSSLSTVTLDPPTISFNIKEPSKTLDAIRAANGRFRVHFPAAERGGANLVDLFCRGNHADAYNLRAKELKIHQPKDKKNPLTTRSLAPQILNSFVLAAFECEVTQEFPVADHVILVAKVHDIEQKTSEEPAILYVDGRYRKPNGEAIYSAARTKALATDNSVGSVWSYPLFPGDKERLDYLGQIKALIKANPAYYEQPNRNTYRSIDAELPYPAANFGISLALLVSECRKEMGLPAKVKPELEGHQVLNDFYGPLTPSMREQIVERAKDLIALDSRFLSQNYTTLLYNLGVNPNSRDFLPSDIMKPLRAANLAPPFEPRRGRIQSTTYDIRKVEQIEFHLRGHFRKMKFLAALQEPFEDAMEAIGEQKVAALHFKKSRSRLLVETHPTLFDSSAIDIAGEVTQEELRVVLCRLINRLNIYSQADFRGKINQDWCEHLRRVGVNPTITGMDVEFLMGKIKHLFLSTRQFKELPRAISNMLKPWFIWNVSWDDLEERVKRFVETTPLRATTWSTKDRLAAMGLHWEATVTLPNQGALSDQAGQPLGQGHILDTLVAKELKQYYGKGTEEENKGIAKYLKETYRFDVTRTPIQYTPAASEAESSGDEMQQAMLANLSTDEQKQWLELPKSNKPPRYNPNYGRRQETDGSVSGVRIRFNRGQTLTKSGNIMRYPDRQESDKEFEKQGGTYSFAQPK